MADYCFKDKLNFLSFADQVLFITICAHRMARLFNLHYDETLTEPTEIINLLVTYLTGGVIDSEIDPVIKKMERTVPNVDESGSEYTPSMYAGVSLLYALDAVKNRSEEDILKGLSFCFDAIESFTEYEEHGLIEEKQFHSQLLERIKDGHLSKDDMDGIREYFDITPEWEKWWFNSSQ